MAYVAGANKKSNKDNQSDAENDSGSDLIEMLVSIRRVAKVVKGGRTFRFSALVVVGDGKGRVGYGSGSGVEVMDAKKKATESAKRSMIRVQLREGRTFHHDVIGCFGAGKVNLRSASAGTGIIAGGALRAVFECLGVNDVVAKSIGTPNPHNVVKACFDAFSKLSSPRSIAEKRGIKVGDIIGRRDSNSKGTEE
jgi:small subunit ribosomal protein S5